MELRDIRYFAAVAEHQNIGRAAEALELSATALSKSLRRLEKSVGAKLIKRAPKGVALTAVGAALLTRIGPLQGILNDVRHETADLAGGHAGHVHVGVATGAAENLLADACVLLSKETSKITFKITAEVAPNLEVPLHKGEMDFCVASPQSFPQAQFVHERLDNDQWVVFASAKHRLAGRKRVSLADITRERWTSTTGTSSLLHWQQLFRALEDQGFGPPTVALETNSRAVRLAAIAFADYLGVSSRWFLREEARRYPLVELPVSEISLVRRLSIIYRKDGYLSPAARRLIEIIKAQVKEMSDGERGSKARG